MVEGGFDAEYVWVGVVWFARIDSCVDAAALVEPNGECRCIQCQSHISGRLC